MMKAYFKYAALVVIAAATFGCEVEESGRRYEQGKGITVLRDAAAVIEDYADFARVGFAACLYSRSTTEEKIVLENSTFSGYGFRRIDDAWEVTKYYKTYYASFELDEDETVTKITVVRAREYHTDGKPVFDTCYFDRKNELLWTVTAQDVEIYDYYDHVSKSTAYGTLQITGGNENIPAGFAFTGEGGYTSVRSDTEIVEVEWSLENGLMDSYSWEHFRTLWKGTLTMESGKPGSSKDKIEAVFDMDVPSLRVTVNGVTENTGDYF